MTEKLPDRSPRDGETESARRAELQKVEAEWISQELSEFVKLIQQYRILYLSAVFLGLGWALGQLMGATQPSTGQQQPDPLSVLRMRSDIAVVLCFIPLINVLFALSLLEAAAQVRTLARYRFILGVELGNDSPAWRWEIWKSSKVGSIGWWTAPLNVVFAAFLALLSAGSLWFAYPAVEHGDSTVLSGLWATALAVPLAVLLGSGIVGWRYRKRTGVPERPATAEMWNQLTPPTASGPGPIRRILGTLRDTLRRRRPTSVNSPAGLAGSANVDSSQSHDPEGEKEGHDATQQRRPGRP